METVTSQDHEDELELGLGLSLGSGSGGGGGGVKILTAQDLPSVMTGNHSGGCRLSGGGANISGNKRAAADSPGSPPPVSQVVGWPPIRTYRMNNLANQTTKTEEGKKILGNENSCSSHQNNNNNKTNNDANKKPNNGGLDKSKAPPPMRETGQIGFVKVNMDGVQIGRKIDLNAHACYDTLAQTIEEMFFKPNSCTSIGSTRGDVQQQQPPPPTKRSSSKLLEGSSEFVLVYEDKEGDWMLVGDVPWGMFLSTVKRLRIMRTCEANGLAAAPRFQERSLERQRSKHI